MPIKVPIISTLQRTTYLGVVWDSTTIQAQLSADHITDVRGVRESQPLTVKQFQKLLGLMAAASNVILFGLLHMRLLQCPRSFPEGESASHDQGHGAMLTCLRPGDSNICYTADRLLLKKNLAEGWVGI